VPADSAIGKFHIAKKTLRKLNKDGKLSAWRGVSKNGRPCILLSTAQLRLHVRTTVSGRKPNTKRDVRTQVATPAAPDLKPIRELFRKFHANKQPIGDHTLESWCEWDPHPALGRKVRSGAGPYTITAKDGEERDWRGLMMSESDADACVNALKLPPERKKYPNNPGVWILVKRAGKQGYEPHEKTEGIFALFDGDGKTVGQKLFFTAAYIEHHYGFAHGSMGKECYKSKLDRLEVTLPGCKNRWQIDVYSQESVERLVEWRSGKFNGGRWLDSNKMWVNAQGERKYSGHFIAEQLVKRHAEAGKVVKFRDARFEVLAKLRSGELEPGKCVPKDRDEKNGKKVGGVVRVHDENSVFRLLDIPVAPLNAPTAANGTAAPTPVQTGNGGGEPARGAAPAPPNAAPGNDRGVRLPTFMSAPDLAAHLGHPTPAVDSFLRRFRATNADCFEEVPTARRNEPRIVYRVMDVMPALVGHFAPK
jgi:hypothetical protein